MVVLIAEVRLTGRTINESVNNRGVSNGGINNRGVGTYSRRLHVVHDIG